MDKKITLPHVTYNVSEKFNHLEISTLSEICLFLFSFFQVLDTLSTALLVSLGCKH